jgi:hypothetical protein
MVATSVLSVLPVSAIAAELTAQEPEQKACGATDQQGNLSVGTDKSKHPTPSLPADQALIYVVRPARVGRLMQPKLAGDGGWRGANRANIHFFSRLDPGEPYFCSEAHGASVLKLKVEAAKTYYLQQHVQVHVVYASHRYNKITLMTEDEGIARVATIHPSTWRIH